MTIHSAGSDVNSWSYGYGNPTSYVDPDGRLPVLVVAAIVGVAVSATVYCVTNGVHVTSKHWWAGLGIAAGSGAVAGLTGGIAGIGMGAAIGSATAATFGDTMAVGAATGVGGSAGGYLASWGLNAAAAEAGGNFSSSGCSLGGLGKASRTGLVSGGISGGGTNLGGAYIGTAAGTSAGIAFGSAAWGEDVTWSSLGMSFATAFGGAIASAGLSKGWSEATERNTEGYASRDEAAKAGMRKYQPEVAASQENLKAHEIGFLIYELNGRYGVSEPIHGLGNGVEIKPSQFYDIDIPSGATITDVAHIHPELGQPWGLTDGGTVMSPPSPDDMDIMSNPTFRSKLGLSDQSRMYVGTPDGKMAILSKGGLGPKHMSLPRLEVPVVGKTTSNTPTGTARNLRCRK
ncbi:MAG: hypothetical protein QM784_33515 [Polyangiaceae bacterium]